MGYTDHGPFEVQMLIAEMAKRWPGRDACPSFARLVLFRGPKGSLLMAETGQPRNMMCSTRIAATSVTSCAKFSGLDSCPHGYQPRSALKLW